MICPNPKCKASKKKENSLKTRFLWGLKIYTCTACGYIKIQKR